MRFLQVDACQHADTILRAAPEHLLWQYDRHEHGMGLSIHGTSQYTVQGHRIAQDTAAAVVPSLGLPELHSKKAPLKHGIHKSR